MCWYCREGQTRSTRFRHKEICYDEAFCKASGSFFNDHVLRVYMQHNCVAITDSPSKHFTQRPGRVSIKLQSYNTCNYYTFQTMQCLWVQHHSKSLFFQLQYFVLGTGSAELFDLIICDFCVCDLFGTNFFYVTSHTFSFSFQTLKTRQNFKMSVSLCGTQMYRLKRVTYIHVLFMYFFPKPLPSYYHFIFCDTHIGNFLVFASALIYWHCFFPCS